MGLIGRQSKNPSAGQHIFLSLHGQFQFSLNDIDDLFLGMFVFR